MTFEQKPQFQQFVPNLQNRIQGGVNKGPVQSLASFIQPTLPFDIASQVVKWSTFEHTVGAAAKIIILTLPRVPVDETHLYHAISVDEPNGWRISHEYKAQGVLGFDAKFIEMMDVANQVDANLIAGGDPSDTRIDHYAQPIRVYPGGELAVFSFGQVAALTKIRWAFLWSVAPPPIQVGAEVVNAVATET